MLKELAFLLLGILVVLAAADSIAGGRMSCEDCNVVLISVEPWRKDSVGVYGGPENTTPNIDALARDSIVFENAYTTSGHTTVATYSTMTSLYPFQHGISSSNARDQNTSKFLTLAEVFSRRGYRTEAFTWGTNVAGELGLSQGFDRYRKAGCLRYREIGECSERTNLSEVLGRGQDGKLFLYYQSFRPHFPYYEEKASIEGNKSEYRKYFNSLYGERRNESSKGAEGDVSELNRKLRTAVRENKSLRPGARREYLREVRGADRGIGVLIDELREKGMMDDTVVIITSQHGESIYEHGYHGHNKLYNEVVNVPLVMHVPGVRGRRVEKYVSLLDLAPTLTEITGVVSKEFSRKAEGVSLIQIMRDKRSHDYLYAFPESEAFIDVDKELKLLRMDEGTELYNLERDSSEQNPLGNTSLRNRMEKDLRRFLERHNRSDISKPSFYPYYS